MKIDSPATRLSLAAAALLLAAPAVCAAPFSPAPTAPGVSSPVAKRIVFTTKSDEARKAAEEAVRMIESFRGGPAMLPVAQKAVAADPNFAFAHYLVGTAMPPAQGKPHIDKAIELAKSASDAERRYIDAVMLTRTNQAEKAAVLFQELAREYPDERMVHMMLGQVSFNQGKLDDARTAFERAIKLDASTPRAHALLGTVFLFKNDFATSRQHYKHAVERRVPQSIPFQAYFGLAYSYVYEGNLQPAIDTLLEFEKVYTEAGGIPGLPPVFVSNAIARLYLEHGKPEIAITYYDKGYQTVPTSQIPDEEKQIWLGRLHHGRGRAYSKMGKHAEAWKEAETIKAMIEKGGDRGKEFWPSYHYIAGYLRLEGGQYPEALEHLKQANKDDVFHRLLLARAYEKTGDATSAQSIYREIVESKQNNLERAIAYPEARRKLKN